MSNPRVVTAVVGAGPAGLLFSVAASVAMRSKGCEDQFALVLFDKRLNYQRTHRLRIDPEPFRTLATKLSDPRFDTIIAKLDECGFSPPVNELELWLSDAARSFGITKRTLVIGPNASLGDLDLDGLAQLLREEGTLLPNDVLSIVGADSVHSAVREMVRGDRKLVAREHQRVARLRVTGSSLPKAISAFEKLRLSKALASAVDYRLNRNGYAEADLLLDAGTIGSIESLGATPSQPVELTARELVKIGSPFVARIVQHFASEIGEPPNTVVLQSTFRLEHQYCERVAFVHSTDGAGRPAARLTFLVGDAAASLPFFRGMACLTESVQHLVTTHCELVDTIRGLDHNNTVANALPAAMNVALTVALDAAADGYDAAVRGTREREIATVDRRARLVAVGREIGRISAMLPFPMQVLLLSLDRRKLTGPLARRMPSPEDRFNALVAFGALACVIPRMLQASRFGWILWGLGLFLQLLGGAVFRSSEQFALHRSWARIIWFVQIGTLLIGGVSYAAYRSIQDGSPQHWVALTTWLVMGIVFIPGIYLAEKKLRG
jgi:hypothetical protein